ncbi:MAG: hypothetical protein RLZZ206_2168 [Cyanobacteriota bacterium]|jgi:type I restriction enzyme S subunit
MIADLKPYPALKGSDDLRIGEIPEHWEIEPLCAIAKLKSVKNQYDRELLSVYLNLGVVPFASVKEKRTNVTSEDLSSYQAVDPGDFVLNNQQAWRGSVGVSMHKGIVSPAYLVLSLGPRISPRYANLLLRERSMVAQYLIASKGVGSIQRNLYWPHLKRIPIILPPFPEQAAIVRFLDHADRKIRRYIRAKQKLIKLLEEQKQAIIHRAVTRGLDPNVRLKASGVEWLGDVPEHWEVTRVKNEFFCLNRRRIPLSATERGAMTLRRYDYYGASGAIDKVAEYLFDDDLLLIAEDGANLVLRNLPLAIIARGKFWVNNHAHILKPKRGSLEYLAGVMECINYQPWISGAAQPKLTLDRLMSVTIAVAPPEEQEQIVKVQNEETGPLRAAIKQANREITLLREYRTRMIADLVTGKLDVREAASQLPDEVQGLPLIDELDEVNDPENDAVDDLDEAPEDSEP